MEMSWEKSENRSLTQVKACNFIKKRLQQLCFTAKFAKFVRTPFLTEYLR